MSRKSKGGGLILTKSTRRKRPGRHSKKLNKKQYYKPYMGQGRK